MRQGGFIKLHRKLLSWEWYTDVNTKTLFLHLLLKVRFKNSKFRGKEVKSGEIITSNRQLSDETGLSVRQIRTALDKLKSTGEITVQSTNRNSLIKVVNYAKYQAPESKNDTGKDKQIGNQTPNSESVLRQTGDKPSEEECKECNIQQECIAVVPYDQIKNYYNEMCDSLDDNPYSRVVAVNGKRRESVAARFKDFGLEGFQKAFEYMATSEFLKGGATDWTASFDWLIKPSNFQKVLEGNYNRKQRANKKLSGLTEVRKNYSEGEDFIDLIAKEGWTTRNADRN